VVREPAGSWRCLRQALQVRDKLCLTDFLVAKKADRREVVVSAVLVKMRVKNVWRRYCLWLRLPSAETHR
jgi:hypothetical protein